MGHIFAKRPAALKALIVGAALSLSACIEADSIFAEGGPPPEQEQSGQILTDQDRIPVLCNIWERQTSGDISDWHLSRGEGNVPKDAINLRYGVSDHVSEQDLETGTLSYIFRMNGYGEIHKAHFAPDESHDLGIRQYGDNIHPGHFPSYTIGEARELHDSGEQTLIHCRPNHDSVRLYSGFPAPVV